VKKSKSDRKAKSNVKALKDAEARELKTIEKAKTPSEAVPLLDNPTNTADDSHFSLTTRI